MAEIKLFMVLLGCKPDGRHVEQHDVFFGIGASLPDLKEDMEKFWPDSGKLHIDAWREVTTVDGYQVKIETKTEISTEGEHKLFFINLGGYQPLRFEEQHYIVLSVKPDKIAAINEAKQTLFFRHNHFAGASSHIDDKYGVDVDELYEIEDILPIAQKEKFRIVLSPVEGGKDDEIHLGYLKFSRLT